MNDGVDYRPNTDRCGIRKKLALKGTVTNDCRGTCGMAGWFKGLV